MLQLLKTNKIRRTVLVSWFISYLVILIIPVIGNIFTYTQSRRALENEVNETNHLMLSNLQSDVDLVFQETEKIATELSYNSRVNEMMKQTEVTGAVNYLAYEISNDLQSYILSAGENLEIYLYFPKLEMIVTRTLCSGSANYFAAYYSGGDLTYPQWKELLTKSDKRMWISQSRAVNQGRGAIEFVRSLPVYYDFMDGAVVSVALDRDSLFDNMTMSDERTTVAILDQDRNVLASRGMEYAPGYFTGWEFQDGYNLLKFSYEGEKMAASYIDSSLYGLKYIYILPDKVFSHKIHNVWVSVVLSIILYVIMCLIVIQYALKINYSPVRDLMLVVDKLEDGAADKGSNEYNAISRVIDKLVSTNQSKDSELSRQEAVVRNHYLAKLLKGRADHANRVRGRLEELGIDYHRPGFVVALFYVDNFGTIFQDDGEKPFDEGINLAFFAVANIIEEFVSARFVCHVFECDGRLACIVNTSGSAQEKEDLCGRLTEAQAAVADYLEVFFTIAVSSSCRELSNLPKLYKEAEYAMEYRTIIGEGELIDYETIDQEEEDFLYYPLSTEQELMDLIKSGNSAAAKEVIEDVWKKNFEDHQISPQITQCLIYNLTSTMIKALNEISGKYRDRFFGDTQYVNDLLGCSTIQKLKVKIFDILEEICEFVGQENENNVALSDRVQAFIAENYSDPSLNVTMIGREFELTASYVSKLFTMQTGQKLLDYINHYRIERAKQLIRTDPETTVEKISERVGYTSTRTFFRVFKKVEGVSPSQYKERIQ